MKAPSWRKRRGRGGDLLTRGTAAPGSSRAEKRRRTKARKQGTRSDRRPAELIGVSLPVPDTAPHDSPKTRH